MFKLSELFVEITAPLGGLDSSLKKAQANLKAASQKMGASASINLRGSKFASGLPQNSLAKPGKKPKSGGGGGSARQFSMLPAVAATGAIAAGLSKAVGLASNLAETVSKVGVVFGDSASIVTKAANEMGAKFGIPKAEMMDAVSIMGLMAKGAGQSEKASAEFGVGMAKLGLDAASFYNVPLDTALEKIRAGLSGESEPLRAFGVFLTENSVKAKAAQMGLAKYGSELTEGQKIMARSVLISEGLSDAQGDLERTQGGFANQSRELWGRLENLAAQIGEELLPVFTELITATNDVVKSFELGFGGMKQSASGFVNFFKSAIETIGVVYRNWGAIVERTGVMIGGWWANLVETIAWLGASIGTFLGWFATNWRTIFRDAFLATLIGLDNLARNFMKFGESVFNWIASGFSKPFTFEMTPILDGFKAKTAALKMPKLNLSNVDDQLAEIDNKMVNTEQGFQDKKDKDKDKDKDTEKKEKAPLADLPTKEKKKKEKEKEKEAAQAEFVGVADFAKRIQSGALDQSKIAKDQLAETRKGNDWLQQIAKGVQDPKPAVAAA